jgi:hypothetical protein
MSGYKRYASHAFDGNKGINPPRPAAMQGGAEAGSAKVRAGWGAVARAYCVA